MPVEPHNLWPEPAKKSIPRSSTLALDELNFDQHQAELKNRFP